MGIPRLCSRLEHFGEDVRRTVTRPEQGEEPPGVVIDGPSLAYHIYREWLDKASDPANFGNIVSSRRNVYGECAAAAVAWLERLEIFGLRIIWVVFDGGLPASKFSTRIDRLQSLATELVTLRSRYDEKAKLARSTGLKMSEITQAHTLLPQDPRQRPIPPFLVFAIREELSHSERFRNHVQVVPDEADPWCAWQAWSRSRKGNVTYVFSSDSDLFVHDLGDKTWLVMFKDVEHGVTEKEEVLRMKRYSPATIAESHGLPDLMRVAYLMSLDPTKSFRVAVEDARLSTYYEGYVNFEDEYRHPCMQVLPAGFINGLHSTDSRISEYLVEIYMTKTFPNPSRLPTPHQPQFDIFLPVLIEDPSRASAWVPSQKLRNTAYSFSQLMLGDNRNMIVHEFRRVGHTIGKSQQVLTSAQTLVPQMQELADYIFDERSKLVSQSHAVCWRLLALKYVLLSLHESQKKLLPLQEAIATAKHQEPRTWNQLHFLAQVHATLYSIRMLKQVLAWVSTWGKPDGVKAFLPDAKADLAQLLEWLPGIAASFDPGAGTLGLAEAQAIEEYVRGVYEGLEVEGEEEGEGVDRKAVKAKRKAERKRKREELGERVGDAPREKVTNMFAALADE